MRFVDIFGRNNILTLLSLVSLASMACAADNQLFTYSTSKAYQPQSIAAMTGQGIEVNFGLLMSSPNEFEINLPDGPVIHVQRDYFEKRSKGVMWTGHVDGKPESQVGLTVHKGYISARIVYQGGLWEISPVSSGHVIEKLQGELFPACEVESHQEEARHLSVSSVQGDPDPCPSPIDSVNSIDLLVLYTQSALDGAGGKTQIEAVAQSAVDRMNESFANSNTQARVRLAHTELSTQDDTGSFSDDLDWLKNDSGVAQLRNQYFADMVSMLNNTTSSCGRGQVTRFWSGIGAPNAVHQVTYRGCAIGNLSFAHEHGHNMGLEHDPENGCPGCGGTYPYRFGHFISGSYRTVMSYSNQCAGGCTRQPYYSNPAVSFMGAETGVTDERENQRVLNKTAKCVTDYRVVTATLFSNGFED